MKVRKYVVKEMQEALQVIKEDLGPDAVIISSYKLPRKSIRDFFTPPRLEVTAAVEEIKEAHEFKDVPTPKLPPANAENITGDKLEQLVAQAFNPLGITRTQASPGETSTGWQPLLVYDLPDNNARPLLPLPEQEESPDSLFKKLLERQGDLSMEQDVLYRWKKILLDLEIQASLVERLLDNLKVAFEGEEYEQRELIKASLKGKISRLLEQAYQQDNHAGIFTFIGPTGVGKTTTLAKLATRFSVIEKKKIALIAVYSHRFGMVEELKFYADTIRVPVEVVMTPAELAQAVQSHADKDFILIDTEGIPAKNTSQVLKLKSFLEAVGQPQEIFLVLSSTTKNKDLIRISTEFLKLGFNKMIFTKLDETETCGSMLNVVCRTGTPVAYVTNGQNIPDDISVVQPQKLAGLLLKGVDRYEDLGA